MKAAKLTEHPSFRLMRQTDVQNVWHMQMPRWLFSDPRYADMSLDAKVTYTFLLNRFQLSRRNGWVNDAGEVFVIFPRKALAKELRICEQRVTAAFRKLAELQLIWEKRCGRGDANQIYLASVTPIDDPGYECAPFCSESYESCGSRTADSAFLDAEEPQDVPPQNPEIPAFRTADSDVPEPQDPGASNTDFSQPDTAFSDVSPSVPSEDGPTDDEKELTGILDACELSYFEPEVARVFENAIERLFYSDNLRIGQAVLPQKPGAVTAAPAELFRFAGSGDQAAREPECAGQGFYEIRYVNDLQLHHGNGERPAGRSVSQFAALAAGKGARLMLLTKQQKYLLAVLETARLRGAAAACRAAAKDVCLFFA